MAFYISECILYAVLAVCAVTDIRHHQIPNRVTAAGAAAGLLCAFGAGAVSGASVPDLRAGLGYLGRMALVAAAGFPFFVFRMIGAGDIKLMAVMAAYLGMDRGLKSIGVGLCLGAVLALGRLLREGSGCQRFSYLTAYIRRFIHSREIEAYYCPERDGYRCVIPLGACFLAGTLVTSLWKA